MAKESASKTKTNNLESDKKNTKYEITFGYFNENKKGEMDFPPKNSKKYSNLLENIQQDSFMEIVAKKYKKVLDKNGKVSARIGEDGNVLTGKVPVKASKKSETIGNVEK